MVKTDASEGQSELQGRKRRANWLSALESAGFRHPRTASIDDAVERELNDGVVLVARLSADYRIATIEVRSRYADGHERMLCEFSYNHPGDIGPSVKLPV
jgi:hypothetical protein